MTRRLFTANRETLAKALPAFLVVSLLLCTVGAMAPEPFALAMGSRPAGQIQQVWQDPATGLVWYRLSCRAFREHYGGLDPLNLFSARSWISLLNNRKAGGFSDWRLPSIDEYRTIFKEGAGQEVYEYRSAEPMPLFTLGYRPPIDGKQRYAWSRDTDQAEAWAFDFVTGEAGKYPQAIEMTYEFEALAVRGPLIVTEGVHK